MPFWRHLPTETLEFVKQRSRFGKLPTDDATTYAIWKLLPYHRWKASREHLIAPYRAAEARPTDEPTPDKPSNPQEE